MRRGTRVGEAYVNLAVDGDGINDDIADAFDDVDYKSIGDEHGRQYAERIRSHLTGLNKDFDDLSERMGNRLSSRLSKAIESDNALTQGVSKMLAEAFDDGRMDELVKHVGRRAGVTFGGEFDKEVRRSVMDSLEGALERAARSGDFDLSAFIRSIDSGSGEIPLLGSAIDDAVRRVEAAHKKMEGDLARSIAERIKQERKGEQIVAAIRSDYAKTWESLLKKRETDESNWMKMLERAYALNQKFNADRVAGERRWNIMVEAAHRLNARFDEDREASLQRLGTMQDRAARENAQRDRDRNRMLSLAYRLNEKFDANRLANTQRWGALQAQAIRLNEKFDADRLRNEREWITMVERAHNMNVRFDEERLARLQRMGALQARAARMNAQFDAGKLDGQGYGVSGNASRDRGDIIGRMFGAGSRNNFLNLLGKTIGNVVNLTDKAAKFAGGFADRMNDAADGASTLQRIMAGFGAGGGAGILARLGPMMASALPAIGAVLIALSAMASVVGALVGLLTAMASTITSALVGALAIVGPMLGAVAVAGGLVAVAFTSMTNAQKDYLFSAFQPFKAALTGIGQIIFREFVNPLYAGQSAIQVWSGNLQRALLPVGAVATLTARAFADAGNIITASLSGPGFQRFFAALGSELPGIVRNLASALGGFLNGTAGMFAAIMPFVSQFARYLRETATRFSEWANSAKGQNSIYDFVQRALGSLKSLWGAVKQIGGFISDVFFNPVSQRAGNSIFNSIADTFAGFRRSFARNIANGNVERWFNDAIKFGGKLWGVINALWGIFMALYNSGVLEGVGNALSAMAGIMNGLSAVVTPLIDALGRGLPGSLGVIPAAVQAALGPLGSLWNIIKQINDAIGVLSGKAGGKNPADFVTQGPIATAPGGFIGPWAPGTAGNPMPYIPPLDLPDLGALISSGNTALNNTYESAGGYMPDPSSGGAAAAIDKIKTELKKLEEEWVNPYIAFANSIIKRAPTVAEEIREAAREASKVIEAAFADVNRMLVDMLKETNTSLSEGIRNAAQSLDVNELTESFRTMINSAIESANSAVQSAYDSAGTTLADAIRQRDELIATAQAGVQAAAQALASAGSEKEAKAALKALRRAEKDLDIASERGRALVEQAERAADAMRTGAEDQRQRVRNALTILDYHSVLSLSNVEALLNGAQTVNVTMADYAEARRQVAEKLAAATEQLTNAVALRNNYAAQVTESIRSFGALTTAQAQVINGVAQALTFTDITDNLRDRLDRVKKFNENLRQLLAQGLSDAAYKQIVDAGVDTGGAYAEAILAGGQGAVSEVNSLVGQIDSMATLVGNSAANHMYQAGVDAAAGLVEGLMSLSNELTTAATQLGNAIAQAIASALGIASPSRVLRAMMSDVGDGAALGLDDQHPKISAAAARFSDQIKVSPEVARYAAEQGESPTTGERVSGNSDDPRFRDLSVTVVTPTEDPHAVATETINEITGRL